MAKLMVVLFLLIVQHVAVAQGAPDPALERRAAALSDQLRCLVCQNQTIADSNAPLAVELKKLVRVQLAAGRSETEVIDFMVQRYGDFVLYRPPVKPLTWLLWGGPLLLLGFGLALLFNTLRGMRDEPDPDGGLASVAGVTGKEIA